MFVNVFDTSVLSYVNQFSRLSMFFDLGMTEIVSSPLWKGGLLMAMLWWFWFQEEKQNYLYREQVISTVAAAFIGLICGRVMAFTLPFRIRPLHNPTLNFQIPYGVSQTTLQSWSSFPSDHAVMFFALATGIWLMSRTLGAIAFVYVLVGICLPRIYLGLHYPTDILAGALIGMGIAWIVNAKEIRRHIARPALFWLDRGPGSFYAFSFLLTFEIASMFDDIRELGRLALTYAHISL